jgi:thymidine kinase
MAGRVEVVCGCMFCHRGGQPILMGDGRILPIETINLGDRVMGPSGPAEVVMLHTGKGQMAEVRPKRGEPFVVTLDHELTLTDTPRKAGGKPSERGGRVVDVPVREWLGWKSWKKNIFKLFRVGVEAFAAPPIGQEDLDPYFLGLLLGDGTITDRVALTSADKKMHEEMQRQAGVHGLRFRYDKPADRCPGSRIVGERGRANPIADKLRELDLYGTTSGTKFIPYKYKVASLNDRLALLAGLLDTDGSLTNGAGYDYISKSQALAEDVAFVARSVGLHAAVTATEKHCQDGGGGLYYRTYIGGDVSEIPVRLERKKTRHEVKHRPTVTAFEIVELPEPERYFGLTVEGGRYLLGDFLVTHNSGKTEELLRRLRRAAIKQKVLLIKPALDDRYSDNEVVSHSEHRMPAVNMHPVKDRLEDVWDDQGRPAVVGIDEAQFFDLDYLEVELLADHGTRVIIAALDLDYRGEPFLSSSILSTAEEVQKLTAICDVCGAKATRTQRLCGDDERVVLGGKGAYEARCREHWTGESKG